MYTYFSKEIFELMNGKITSNKNLASLTLFLDLTWSYTRWQKTANADVHYAHMHPLLLPSRNRIVELMLKFEHKRLGHAGVQRVF